MTLTREPLRTAPRLSLPAPTALLAAVLTGLAGGVATSWLQGHLTGGWYVLADSGAVWTVVAFVVAAAVAGPRWLAVTSGTLALLCEVAGYYALAAQARGIAVTVSEQVVWTVAALWVGPLAGLAGWAWRQGRPTASLVGAFGILGVVLGEGVDLIRRVQRPDAGWGEITAAVAVAAVVVTASRASWPQRLAGVATGVVVALGVYSVYGIAVFG
jgi:hypothetical protein